MIGSTISHYKILEKLGAGGMGVVYKALDTRLDRHVALKFLPPDLTRDHEARQRFIHEAKAASALQHPNICTIHDIDETDDGQLFLVMDCYEGEPLKEKIARGPLKLEEAIDIAIQVSSGLSKAHEKGIIHRDIKPGNLVLTTDGTVKIVDFGLAKLTGRTVLTQAGQSLGTPAYMSPEQARGETVDHRIDIWSLGVMLYEMLTGRLPFTSDYRDAVVYSILNEAPAPITGVRTGVPMELERIVNKCMAKDAKERYQHTDEIATDLKGVLRTSVGDRTVGKSPSTQPKRRRASLYGGMAAVAVLLAVGLLVIHPFASVESTGHKTVAVLPFTNLSDNPEEEYFSDGITEDIITQLTKIVDLTIISRTTMMQYKGTEKSLREIGAELNAGIALEGSVRRSGNRIRIVAQLIDAQSDRHLWAETYDRELTDIFEIQSDVAQRIAVALDARLSSVEKRNLEISAPSNAEVYGLLLEGRYLAERSGRENLTNAINIFMRALQLDSTEARLWAALSNAYVRQAGAGYAEPLNILTRARRAAEKSIALDGRLAQGHLALGNIKNSFDWDWEGAEKEYRKALLLEPGNAAAISSLAWLCHSLGQFDEAIVLHRKARELRGSLTKGLHEVLAFHLMYANRLDEALFEAKKGTELNLHSREFHPVLGQLHVLQGNADSAIIVMQEELPSWKTYVLALAHHRAGRKWEANAALDELITKFSKQMAFQIAEVYAYRGDVENAFLWLERAYLQRDGGLSATKGDPFLRNIEHDPRYAAFMKKMRLPL